MDIDEILERIYSGKLYFCDNEELMKEQERYLDKVFEYNSLKPSKRAEKERMLKEMFAQIGENCYVETPFYANWGGKNVYFGDSVYANFNLTLVDDCDIYVGSNVMMGPNVTLVSASHPISPELREKQVQYNLPVNIKKNVWLGAGCIVLPGVTIGENSVIGAGSVVTKNIPANVVAAGVPCRVLREISDRDRCCYHKDFKIDID